MKTRHERSLLGRLSTELTGRERSSSESGVHDDPALASAQAIIGLGIVASALHFADNTLEIARYPEPAWITPLGVAVTWPLISLIAALALTRRSDDAMFRVCTFLYAVILMSGLLHYVFGSPMHMAASSNATVIFEAAVGVVLFLALLATL